MLDETPDAKFEHRGSGVSGAIATAQSNPDSSTEARLAYIGAGERGIPPPATRSRRTGATPCVEVGGRTGRRGSDSCCDPAAGWSKDAYTKRQVSMQRLQLSHTMSGPVQIIWRPVLAGTRSGLE